MEIRMQQTRQLFLPGCYVNKPLSPTAAIDPATPAVVTELRKFTDANKLGINTVSWTAQPLLLPADQPLVPVRHRVSTPNKLTAVLKTGVPIPLDWTPTSDGDSHFIGYQPDFITPDGRFRGRYWELFAVKKEDPAANGGFAWSASHGGRMCDAERNRGHFEDFPDWLTSGCGYKLGDAGHPSSTYQERFWGGTGTSIPLLAGMVLKEDVAAGAIRHVIGLSVSEAAKVVRYPAQRGDGYQEGNPIMEGMRLRLPAGHVPASQYPFVRLLEQGVRDHGFIVWDKSSGYVTLRGEPGLPIGSVGAWEQLRTFPWGKLQVLV
jgi:hypothetical protein